MNVPWKFYAACAAGESVDAATYVALHTTIDLDGLLDLLEMHAVHQSWAWASSMNAKLEAERG